jgi:hypothetical protein
MKRCVSEPNTLESCLAGLSEFNYADRGVVAKFRGPALGEDILACAVAAAIDEMRATTSVDASGFVVLVKAGVVGVGAEAFEREDVVTFLSALGATEIADMLERETVPSGDLIVGLVDAHKLHSLTLLVVSIEDQVNRARVN